MRGVVTKQQIKDIIITVSAHRMNGEGQPEPAHALSGAPTFTSAPVHGCRGRRTGQVHVPVCHAGCPFRSSSSSLLRLDRAAAARRVACVCGSAHTGAWLQHIQHITERARDRPHTHTHIPLASTASTSTRVHCLLVHRCTTRPPRTTFFLFSNFFRIKSP